MMEKKAVSDLRTHLSGFEPEYPIKKGYISHLILNEKMSSSNVYTKIKEIVEIAEPDRQLHEVRVRGNIGYLKKRMLTLKKNSTSTYWTELVKLNQENFCISFDDTQSMDMQQNTLKTPVDIVESTPETPVDTVESTPETPVDTVESTPETPVDIVESTPDSARNESVSVPVLFRSPLPKRLKRDCDNCVRKNRTIASMQQKNKRLTGQESACGTCFFTVQTSGPSPSRHPELATSTSEMLSQPDIPVTSTSEMLSQPDIPVTSTHMQPVQNSITINSSFSTICEFQNSSTVNSSFSPICELPSPREHKKDCANCATKQRTKQNMLQKNKRLHQKLYEIKMLLGVENGIFSLKRFSNKLKRKTQLVTKWKDRYTPLMEDFKDTHNLLEYMESLDLQVKTLEGKLITYQEENINLASVNQRLESILERAEIDHANLKQENAQLKRSLKEAKIGNTHFKQVHEQLRRVFEKTANNAADMKWHRQASHSPEMEIKEESPWEDGDDLGDNVELKLEEIKQEDIDKEHSKRQRWEVTSDSDETTTTFQHSTSYASMNDMFCGERCQMMADDDCLDHGPSIYIDNAEVHCEYICNEDVITAEEKVL